MGVYLMGRLGRREEGLQRLVLLSFFVHLGLMLFGFGLHSWGKQGGTAGPVSYQVALVANPSTASSLSRVAGPVHPSPPPAPPQARRTVSTPPVPPRPDPDRMVEWWKKNRPNLTEIPPKLNSASPKKPGTVPSSTLPGRRDMKETPQERESTPYWSDPSNAGEGKAPVQQSESASLPGKIAPRGPTVSIQGDRQNDPYYSFVVEKIQKHWLPPMVESDERVPMVEIVFSIGRDGLASEPTVEKSSGNPFLDQAALRAIYQAKPFPHFFSSMREGRIPFRLRFSVGELS
jgi:protein TonB